MVSGFSYKTVAPVKSYNNLEVQLAICFTIVSATACIVKVIINSKLLKLFIYLRLKIFKKKETERFRLN